VLFVDVVGSTSLASELGDASWRLILARFRHVVRSELKRWRGREQDTAGDGFYATFGEPAQAFSAAASILTAVQALGLDLRVGLHTGQCEEVDGKLTGIAVHIGAQVMALAGAAEVLATRTTRDLVVGSTPEFRDAGVHALKGVEGEWQLYRLVAALQPLPGPLEPEVAAERLAELVQGGHRRRRWPLVVGATALAAAAAAVIGLTALGVEDKRRRRAFCASTRAATASWQPCATHRSVAAAAPTCGRSTGRSGNAEAATRAPSPSARSAAERFAAHFGSRSTPPRSRSAQGRCGSRATHTPRADQQRAALLRGGRRRRTERPPHCSDPPPRRFR
jgi:hypothetical protein